MIGESTPRQVGGVQEAETTWNKWFIPYFNFIRTYPTIKAFCYISWDWREYPAWQDWGDARVWANEELLSWYKREISSIPYFHAAISDQSITQP
jgi:hypothetical protein